MPSVAGGVNAPSSSYDAMERTLDRTIDCLTSGPQTREARALLIEARRLRSVVANWRSIPPKPEVRDDMLARVVQLSSSVGAAFPEALPQIAAAATQGPPVSGSGDEETAGYAIDFEPQLYSLDSATNPNRHAVSMGTSPPNPGPLPSYHDAAPQPFAPEPLHYAPEPALTYVPEPVPLSVPPLSDDEPTQLVINTNLKAPADLLEPSSPAPVAWPIEESLHRIPIPEPAPAPRPVLPSIPPEGPGRISSLPVPPARGRALSTPDVDPRGSVPRIITYEFDPEGDDLSVPRTQIAAHTVKLPDPVDPLLVVLADAYSTRADAYRTLRRKLAGLPATRVIGVTSAEPGEGKTTFAVNLALTLRESTRSRVLVVEANLRAPRIGQLLGFETPECFIEQLQRHAEDPRAPWVVAEPLPKLHVMAVDPKMTHEPFLDPVTFAAGMERIKQAGYEYVVVDSPPVLGNLDCNVIADAVDAMILVGVPMKSHRSKMRKAVEQLDPAPILGVVVLEA